MGSMKDALGDMLFEARYPAVPGYKEPTTSKDAARAASSGAAALRERVYEVIRASGPEGLTADQAASLLSRSVLSIRPRVTELAKASRVTPTGARRANESGLKAKVWRAA